MLAVAVGVEVGVLLLLVVGVVRLNKRLSEGAAEGVT
jgi:hypothetical protein